MTAPEGHGAFLAMVPPSGLSHNDLMPVRRRNGSLSIVKGAELRAAEADILPRLARTAPPEPLGADGGALSLEMVVCWPVAEGHVQGEPMTDAPDWDNVAKVMGDLLQEAGWIDDDRLVADARVMKVRMDPPGIRVDVAPIGWP